MTPHDLISRPGGYRLSKGVTATREGLVVTDLHLVHWIAFDVGAITGDMDGWTIPWPDAAERLRYREGEPWCFWHNETDTGEAVVELASHPNCRELFPTLHRLAAIMCDDAEAFRVLHFCITQFGERSV